MADSPFTSDEEFVDVFKDLDAFKPEWEQRDHYSRLANFLEDKFCTVGLTRREFIRMVQLLRLADRGEDIGAFYQANNIPPGD